MREPAHLPVNALARTVCRTRELIASKLAIALQCPLRYLLETERQSEPPLPESVPSLLGTIVHQTSARLDTAPELLDAAVLREGVSEALLGAVSASATARHIGAALGQPASITNLVPMDHLLEKLRIARQIAFEAYAARNQEGVQPRRTSAMGDARERTLGPEVPLCSPSLDLKGRADLIEREGNARRITEFKTGRVLINGEPTPAVLHQICAYGLMQAQRTPTCPITLRIVEPGGEWVRKFERELKQKSLDALEAVAREVPRGREQSCTDAARPGSACGACRFRPQCSSYRDWAQDQWRREGASLPIDTWGEIVEVVPVDQHASHVRLVDASGRRVRIANVPQLALGTNGAGAWLEGFELTCAEIGRGTAHPINLQVVDRRRPFRSAWSALIAVGSTRSGRAR